MYPFWPSDLPCQPILDSLSVQFGDNVARFKPDQGGDIRRRRYTRRQDQSTAVLAMTSAQLKTFKAFYSTVLNDGATSFYMKDWVDGDMGRFAFTSPPAAARVAPGRFRVSMPIVREV